MSYQRIDYTTRKGDLSSAYWEPVTGDAWDVFSRMPVAIAGDVGSYSERLLESPPIPARGHVANRSQPVAVTVRPYISVWMLVPVILFAIGMLWMAQTFLK